MGKGKSQEPAEKPVDDIQENQISVELPEILDKVEYVYSNHVRLSAGKWDVRLAFGDIGPTGQLKPVQGLVLPHLTAKALVSALERVLKRTEERLGRPIEDPQKGGWIEVEADAPKERQG